MVLSRASAKPPETYEEYAQQVQGELNFLERLTDNLTGVDDRIDVTNKLLIEIIKRLITGIQVQRAALPAFPGIPPYNVRYFGLDTARTDSEVNLPGDQITAYTDGTLGGISIKLDGTANDSIPLNEFNPYYYPAKFQKFYLTTTAQAGKYLRLHIGREAGAEAAVQITATAPSTAVYSIETDKDTHFTGSLAQYAKEDEDITGLLTNKIHINQLAAQADQQLDFWLLFWSKDTFEDSDLDLDSFIGAVQLDFPSYGQRIGGAGQYYMSLENLELEYWDDDSSKELHVSLYNASSTAKNSGSTGEIKIRFLYELRT